jgi:hypothetical protein
MPCRPARMQYRTCSDFLRQQARSQHQSRFLYDNARVSWFRRARDPGEIRERFGMAEMNMMFRLHEVTFDDPCMADQNGWYWETINAVDEEVRVDRLVGPFKTEDEAAEAARSKLREGVDKVNDCLLASGSKTRH